MNSKLEVHRRYIGIHYVIAGIVEMGWRSWVRCQRPQGPYDGDNGIEFFNDVPDSFLTVRRGKSTIFFPDDSHAPRIGTGEVHKIVIKVPP